MTPAAAAKPRTSAMIASFADPGQKTTSAPFGYALIRAAEQNDRIVGMSADLAKYTDMHIFAATYDCCGAAYPRSWTSTTTLSNSGRPRC